MIRLLQKYRSQGGTSFLEVMIALLVMAIVTTAVFKLYITQHYSYIAQDQVTNVQQNARASIDELVRHVRMAGYGLPLGMDPIVASNTNPDTITINYASDDCQTYLAAKMPQPSAELKCATDVSCFYPGQWVYIFEPDSGGGEWFELTHVQTGSNHLQHNTMTLSKAYGADAIIMTLTQVKYFIDNTTDPDKPSLMVQLAGQTPQMYAENITDLQFRYLMKNGMMEDEPVLATNVREVYISVAGRPEDPDFVMQIAGVANEDQYRRREYNTSVFLRNVGY